MEDVCKIQNIHPRSTKFFFLLKIYYRKKCRSFVINQLISELFNMEIKNVLENDSEVTEINQECVDHGRNVMIKRNK